jgi:hypothetical protein
LQNLSAAFGLVGPVTTASNYLFASVGEDRSDNVRPALNALTDDTKESGARPDVLRVSFRTLDFVFALVNHCPKTLGCGPRKCSPPAFGESST